MTAAARPPAGKKPRLVLSEEILAVALDTTLTNTEAARRIGCGTTTVRRLRAAQAVPFRASVFWWADAHANAS
jgi:hypothetical protein